MVEVINERKREEAEYQQKIRLLESELATKYTVMGMAVAAQSKKGAKWLQDFVKKMNFLKSMNPDDPEPEKREKELPSTAQVMAAFGAGPDGQVGKRSD